MKMLPEQLKGCKIFPISPGTKLPATKNGWQDASSDETQIAEWHRVNPDFNWAIACGPNKLFVFDVDPAGLDWWAKLLDRDPVIKAAVDRAFTVRTPRGGLHIYFRGEGPTTASHIAKGIDTRGGIEKEGKIISGGYVLLPGSRTDKGGYEALPGGLIEALPDYMQALVPARAKSEVLGLDKNPDKDLPRNIKTATDLINKYVKDGRVSLQDNGGDNTAFKVVTSILDKGISEKLCFDLLWEHWNPHCQPPWEDWELETKIRNGMKHGEDTDSGAKGHQANTAAFAAFEGQVFEQPIIERERDKVLLLHDYADNVRNPEWLIPGMLPSTGVGMIYGESGSFKSFIALDMALTLAYGIPGQWSAPPVKNDVLFMAGEGPVATGKKRWPAWLEWQDIQARNDHRFFIKDRVPFFTDTQAWEHIKEDLAALKAKPSLIVIDTLTRLLTGLDENSAKDASMITNFMEELSRYFECFVLAVHHTGKDQNKGARGSSAFYANMDAVISTKLRPGGTELRVRKQKDADVSDEISFFAVKETGSSIILERGRAAIPETLGGAGKSRFAWASTQEVVKTLEGMGGKASNATLMQEIASRIDVDIDTVRKQLFKNDDLKWLRDGKNNWEIPTQEFDL